MGTQTPWTPTVDWWESEEGTWPADEQFGAEFNGGSVRFATAEAAQEWLERQVRQWIATQRARLAELRMLAEKHGPLNHAERCQLQWLEEWEGREPNPLGWSPEA